LESAKKEKERKTQLEKEIAPEVRKQKSSAEMKAAGVRVKAP
jgi:hypothetical protein